MAQKQNRMAGIIEGLKAEIAERESNAPDPAKLKAAYITACARMRVAILALVSTLTDAANALNDGAPILNADGEPIVITLKGADGAPILNADGEPETAAALTDTLSDDSQSAIKAAVKAYGWSGRGVTDESKVSQLELVKRAAAAQREAYDAMSGTDAELESLKKTLATLTK